MKIFLPYSKLQVATRISLLGYDYEPVKMRGKYGYSKYFHERWEENDSFINIEHDCVPWIGAIQSLVDCPASWCAFDYTFSNWQFESINSVPLGCVKITSKMIKSLRDCWDRPVDWRQCDVHLFKMAQAVGLNPHQHFPSIVNANSVLLK